MIHKLNDDIILHILKLFHRFSYLNNIFLTNKFLYIKTQYIYNFHFNNLNKCLNNNISQNIYLYLSKHLFFNKIINTKKCTNSFLNSLHKFNIPVFVKFFLLIDEYYENIQFNKNIYIVSLQTIRSNILKNNTIYTSFLILYIQKEYVIQIQFLNNLFRMKLKHNNIPINLYKPLSENDILLLLTKKNNNLLKYFS